MGIIYLKWGLPQVWITVSGVLTILAQAYTGIMVSYFGDRLKSKYGRRKPFVVAGFVIASIAALLGALPPSNSPVVLSFWFILTQGLFFAGITACCVLSLLSWLFESSSDPKDYAKIYSLAYNIGFMPGAILGLVMALSMGPVPGSIAFAGFGSISLALLVKYVPYRIIAKTEKQPDIIPSFRSCIRTKEFRTLFLNRCLLYTANDIGSNIALVVVTMFLARTVDDIAEYFLLLTGAVVIGGTVINVAIGQAVQCYDKLQLFKNLTLFIAFLGVIGFFTTFEASGTMFVVYMCVVGACFFPIQMLDNFFLRDLVTADSFLTGLYRENLFQVALDAPAGIASTFFSTIPMVIVYGSGYGSDSDASDDDDLVRKQYEWNDAVIWEVKVIATVVVTLLALVAHWSIKDYPLNDFVATSINEMISYRSAKKIEIQNAAAQSTAGHTFTDEDDIDLDRLDESLKEEFNSMADDKDHMLMMHFLALEVDILAKHDQSAAHRDGDTASSWLQAPYSPLQRIRGFNRAGLVGGMITTLAMLAALIAQLVVQSSSVAPFLAMALIGVSVYTFYEHARSGAIQQLLQLSEEDLVAKAVASSEKNHSYAKTVEACIRNGTIPSKKGQTPQRTGQKESDEMVAAAFAFPLSEFEEVRFKGYKRIYFTLVCLFSIAVISILVSTM